MQQDSQGFYDIYGMVHVPFWQKNSFKWSVALLGIALACCVVWYAVRWFYNRYYAKKISLHDDVLARLVRLKNNVALIESELEIAQLYADLTYLFKELLAYQHGQHVHSFTDDELCTTVLSDGLYDQWRIIFVAILERGKMSKFARVAETRLIIIDDVNHLITYVTFQKVQLAGHTQ